MSISYESKILPTDKNQLGKTRYVVRKINIMLKVGLVFGYTHSAFKVLVDLDDDEHG